MYYLLKENSLEFESDFKGEFLINDNMINIKYKIDEDNKEIVIHLL